MLLMWVEEEKVHVYRACVHVVVVPFFIVEVNEGDPEEDAEENDGVKCCTETKDHN